MSEIGKIGIVGGGAWGTALATVACRAGHETVLYARNAEVVTAINEQHENTLYLAGIPLDAAIRATGDPAEALAADAVLLVTPAQHLREVSTELAPSWNDKVPAVICAKGIEQETCALMSEVLAETLPGIPVSVLSGPNFAGEVARGLPAAATLACADLDLAERLAAALSPETYRVYTSDDVIGAQVGGAVKNVLAIACGIVEGRQLGDNARAALITRGLAEIMRLGAAKGARPETLAGLSGLGDLTLTCNAMQSRNFSLGVALGEGEALADILAARRTVAEGVYTASSVTDLARKLEVEVPICTAIDGVINHFSDIDATIHGLLTRPLKQETA